MFVHIAPSGVGFLTAVFTAGWVLDDWLSDDFTTKIHRILHGQGMTSTRTASEERLAEPAEAPRRSRGLVTEIVQALEADIRQGQLVQGQKLPTESALMTRFEVSRTVVREAISRLQASGLVETRHGVGTFVLGPRMEEGPFFRVTEQDMATLTDVLALLELRISLESESAALAAQRRQDQHLQVMRQALQDFEHAIEQSSDAVPSDFEFHMEVARATGNRYFSELMSYLGTMVIPRTRLRTAGNSTPERQQYLRRVHLEHQHIYDAIAQQDAESARAAMRLHLSNSRERLRKAQQGLPARPPSV